MSKPIIKVENLSKSYLIGHQNNEKYTTLRDMVTYSAKGFIQNARKMLRGKQLMGNDKVEEFFALKNINFEIKKGDRVGIIGRNGAGKSTLLKVLSRITEPTEGRVSINGRVASLLEVGTGFHPELTGRENIYLNGAILGMSREEVKRKFDEIVAFAEVYKFLDTPVKRYSSGMYVRLAFAVAAHLEPEILIVDEVLAVGDAKFQQKCLGKMEDVSKEGRTIVLVSHDIGMISRICNSAILLKNGHILKHGLTEDVVSEYNKLDISNSSKWETLTSQFFRNLSITLSDIHGELASNFSNLDEINIGMIFTLNKSMNNLKFSITIHNSRGIEVLRTYSNDTNMNPELLERYQEGAYSFNIKIPSKTLNGGQYFITLDVGEHRVRWIEKFERILAFKVDFTLDHPLFVSDNKRNSIIAPILDWELIKN